MYMYIIYRKIFFFFKKKFFLYMYLQVYMYNEINVIYSF